MPVKADFDYIQQHVKSVDKLLHGNGCIHYHDCFTCPLPDCTPYFKSINARLKVCKKPTLRAFYSAALEV